MRKKQTEVFEQYFAEKEEQAVLDYISSDSFEEKNKIYNEILLIPFKKMSESILRVYPIHIGNYEMKEVELNALTHLIEHMVKYRPYIIERNNGISDKWIKLGDGYRFVYLDDAKAKLDLMVSKNSDYFYRIFSSKAYSYCQTIIRNYYKDHSRKSYSEKKINVSFDDYADEINENVDYSYEMEYETLHNLERLINNVILKIELKIKAEPPMKKNEVIVGDAIINVLKNWHILFLEDTPYGKYDKRISNKFAKNKILFFLKEQTRLTTKEIRVAIKPFKEIYFFEKTDFFED
jgi:hypothetical protein